MRLGSSESILIAARKIFARYGLKKTSLDEIARTARVAKGTIYNYFETKEGLYLWVLRREADEILSNVLSAMEKVVAPEDKLLTLVKAKFRYMRKAINILNLDKEGVEKYPPAAEAIRDEYFDREVNIIASVLKLGVEKGAFRLGDFFLTARAIGYALRGFELNWLIHESEERIDQYLTELLKLLFFGIMVEPRTSE